MERMSHSMYRIVPHALRRLAALRAAVAALAVAVVWIAPQARGEVVASWNLNAVDPTQWTLYDADVGIGTLDVLGLGASASVLQGTTLGGLKGDVAGNALAAIGTLANGTSMRLDFETGANTLDTIHDYRIALIETGFNNDHVIMFGSELDILASCFCFTVNDVDESPSLITTDGTLGDQQRILVLPDLNAHPHE